MRSFIAISLPANDLLAKVIYENKPMSKAVEGKNLHLTLKFLGDVDNIDEVRINLEAIKFRKFVMTLKGLGAFPSQQSGRLLFVKAYPEDVLKDLAAEVNSKTKVIPLDHPFTPHITLFRVKDRRNFSEVITRYADTVFMEHEVASFSLFESILKPTGPVYREIQKYQLI
ncbi:MAG: RNA 2',3'-cyclic phosphodiesterase [Thermoplasmatales archaeon]